MQSAPDISSPLTVVRLLSTRGVLTEGEKPLLTEAHARPHHDSITCDRVDMWRWPVYTEHACRQLKSEQSVPVWTLCNGFRATMCKCLKGCALVAQHIREIWDDSRRTLSRMEAAILDSLVVGTGSSTRHLSAIGGGTPGPLNEGWWVRNGPIILPWCLGRR